MPAARAYFDELLPQFSPLIADETLASVITKPTSRLPLFRYAGPNLHRECGSTVLLGDAAHSVKARRRFESELLLKTSWWHILMRTMLCLDLKIKEKSLQITRTSTKMVPPKNPTGSRRQSVSRKPFVARPADGDGAGRDERCGRRSHRFPRTSRLARVEERALIVS